jgi:hypothetical protein
MNKEGKIKNLGLSVSQFLAICFYRESVFLYSKKISFKLKALAPLSPPAFEDASSYSAFGKSLITYKRCWIRFS